MSKEKLIVYGSPNCPMVRPVRDILKRGDVAYQYVDIWRQPEARPIVREINDGFESVPTLVFPDGQTLTEPSAEELRAELVMRGYEVRPHDNFSRLLYWAQHPMVLILAVGLILSGVNFDTMWLPYGVAFLVLFVVAKLLDR